MNNLRDKILSNCPTLELEKYLFNDFHIYEKCRHNYIINYIYMPRVSRVRGYIEFRAEYGTIKNEIIKIY